MNQRTKDIAIIVVFGLLGLCIVSVIANQWVNTAVEIKTQQRKDEHAQELIDLIKQTRFFQRGQRKSLLTFRGDMSCDLY